MSIRIILDKELEKRFRELAMKKFGYSKGAISRAAQEAIAMWISRAESEVFKLEEDPIEAIDGLLSDVRLDAVELQHKATEFWRNKVTGHVSD
jgi:hypothetical protein